MREIVKYQQKNTYIFFICTWGFLNFVHICLTTQTFHNLLAWAIYKQGNMTQTLSMSYLLRQCFFFSSLNGEQVFTFYFRVLDGRGRVCVCVYVHIYIYILLFNNYCTVQFYDKKIIFFNFYGK